MIYARVLKDSSYNSLKLRYLKRSINEAEVVDRAQVVMGTEANKAFLKEIGLFHEDIESAEQNELVITVDAADEMIIDEIIEKAEKDLNRELAANSKISMNKIPNLLEKNNYLSKKEVKSQFFLRRLSHKREMGKIHSIFKTSFNLMFDNKLVNFSTVGMPVTPHGSVLNKKKIDKVLDQGNLGDIVKVENEIFTFYTRGKVFEIDLSQIEEIAFRVPAINLTNQELTQTNIYRILKDLSFEKHIGLKNERRVRESLQTMRHLPEQKNQKIQKVVDYLIGRGSGLTPSGDDILLGYTMIRQAFKADDYFIRFLEEGINNKSTTAVSMAYYDSLLAGYVSSIFSVLISEIDEEDFHEIKQLTGLITFYGHTSGYDTLFGFYLGLQSIIKEADF